MVFAIVLRKNKQWNVKRVICALKRTLQDAEQGCKCLGSLNITTFHKLVTFQPPFLLFSRSSVHVTTSDAQGSLGGASSGGLGGARTQATLTTTNEFMELDVEQALNLAGEFGWFQLRMFFVFLVFHSLAPMHAIPNTFVGRSPSWKCANALSLSTEAQKCQLLHYNSCEVTYYDDYTSIVSEVSCVATS